MARIIDAPLTSAEGGGCDPRAVHGAWGALDAAARRGLAYTPAIAAETAPLYERVKHVIPAVEWPAYAPLISAINNMVMSSKSFDDSDILILNCCCSIMIYYKHNIVFW